MHTVTTATPNQIHQPVQLCLIFSPLSFFDFTKINRDGVQSQPNLHKFLLSLHPVWSMTTICHPSHFSQLEKVWKMLSICEAEKSGVMVQVGSAHLSYNTPNSLGEVCISAWLTCQIQRWDQSGKSVAFGSSKDTLLICFAHCPQELKSTNFSTLHIHPLILILRKSWVAREMSLKTVLID